MVHIKRNVRMMVLTIIMSVSFSGFCLAEVIRDVPEQVNPEQMVAPMVVEFYRPSCPHCQRVAPVYQAVAQSCTNGTHFYKVNADNMEQANTIAQLVTSNKISKISGVPTFVFAGSNGCEVKTGGMTRQDLQSKVFELR